MISGLNQLRCGNCGRELFTDDETRRIGVECQGCEDISWIQPEPAKLTIDSGENSGGRIAIFRNLPAGT
ncbi:hypothetical protein [Paraburkholderia aromaticivorans]|uniref:hypothetical protein n=1 Tax=Paraburkholderia aromaticivorans TaxID=2026199 RepID=UPI00145602CB|nr:hypothetical protein [Paraburkholderia aromaticivorans]